jgi:hypothetical protein
VVVPQPPEGDATVNAIYTEFGPPLGRLRHGIDAQSIGADDLGPSEAAGPDDLLTVAQSYFSLKDCSNARIWVEKAKEAFHAAGRQYSLEGITIAHGPPIKTLFTCGFFLLLNLDKRARCASLPLAAGKVSVVIARRFTAFGAIRGRPLRLRSCPCI